MNKILYLIFSCLTILLCTSCSDTEEEDNEYVDWQAKNETYFEQQYQKALTGMQSEPGKWMLLKVYSKNDNQDEAAPHTDYVVVHVISQKEAHDESSNSNYAAKPLFGDSVRVHMRGNLMPSASYNYASQSFGNVGYQFDTSWHGDYNLKTMIPTSFVVNEGLIEGFTTALQHMHVGDRWEICIPYQLAYKESSNNSVPAYSTLVFDVTLHSFARSGQSLPTFQ